MKEKEERDAPETEIKKMCICMLTIYMYWSVFRDKEISTVSHREGSDSSLTPQALENIPTSSLTGRLQLNCCLIH